MDNSLFNDPLAMAGLSVMSGKNLGDALNEAAALKQHSDYQAMQMQLWQAQAAQAMQQAKLRERVMQDPRYFPQAQPTMPQGMPQTGGHNPNLQGQVPPVIPVQESDVPPLSQGSYLDSQTARDAEAAGMLGDLTDLPSLGRAGERRLDYLAEQDKRAYERSVDIEKRNYERAAKEKEILVPGYKLTGETMPSADDAKSVKMIGQSKKQLENLISEYETLLDKYGTESDIPVPFGSVQNPFNQEGQRALRQKQAQITLIAKNLEELGALQAPDRQILNDMFADATDIKFATTPNSTAIVKAQVKDYKNYLNDRMDAAVSGRGYAPKDEVKKIKEPSVSVPKQLLNQGITPAKLREYQKLKGQM